MQKTMRLELVSEPESVALVRSRLRQFGAHIGLEPELMDDLATAISEACNNVVLHAYPGDSGKLCVLVLVSDDLVDAEVSDSGIGVEEPVAIDDDASSPRCQSLGLGVALIQALAQQVVFADGPGSGMAVRMSFTRLPFGNSLQAHGGAARSSGRPGRGPRDPRRGSHLGQDHGHFVDEAVLARRERTDDRVLTRAIVPALASSR